MTRSNRAPTLTATTPIKSAVRRFAGTRSRAHIAAQMLHRDADQACELVGALRIEIDRSLPCLDKLGAHMRVSLDGLS
jgi:hypothetical protein